MTADELLAYIEENPQARAQPPDGWFSLLDLPIKEYRSQLDYLMADGRIRYRVPGVSNADLLITPGVTVAWRRSEGSDVEWL